MENSGFFNQELSDSAKKFICVYCGASETCDTLYRDAASHLGRMIGEHDFGLVYGGGRMGLMGLVANGALDHGAPVIGFIPELLDEREGAHPRLTQLHIVDSMHTRKMNMEKHADMFVVMPGGFGTLDELFEIMTWRQLKMHQKPIVILNINGYWDPLKALMNSIVDARFAHEEHRSLMQFVDSIDDVMQIAKNQFYDVKK